MNAYYSLHVDNLISMSFDPRFAMIQIIERMKFKKNKVESPEFNLSASLAKKVLNEKSSLGHD